jgi:hypothetical protein
MDDGTYAGAALSLASSAFRISWTPPVAARVICGDLR